MSSVTDDDQTLAKLEPLARAIDKAIDSLHDAMHKAKQQGCDLQILIVAIDDLPVPSVRIVRDGEAVWCGAEHMVGSGLL
jgi:hypothetical protein